MKYLLMVFVFLAGCSSAGNNVAGVVVPVSDPPYYINATVTDSVYPGASRFVKLCVDADTDKTNGCIYSDSLSMSTSSGSFHVVNISSSGVYFVYAYKDIDANGVFSVGDNYSEAREITLNGNLVITSAFILAMVY